jgi:hypothetical protein
MYSDNRWHEATAGRVYPKVRVEAEPPVVEESFLALADEVRAKLDPRAAFERNARRRPAEPLVKPAAYKALNESNGSGPSGVSR